MIAIEKARALVEQAKAKAPQDAADLQLFIDKAEAEGASHLAVRLTVETHGDDIVHIHIR